MRGIWMDGLKLSEALRRMPQLRHLSVPYIANGPLVEAISRKCAHLKYLDLSGTTELKEQDILNLRSLSSTLAQVNLAVHNDLSPSSVAKLINYLPKLISIGGYTRTGEAIHTLKMDLKRTHPTLLRYLHDRKTSCETLSSIQFLCPDLCSIYFNEPNQNTLKYLKPFKNLRKLKVSKAKSTEVHEMLEIIGARILQLELVCLRESLDLKWIAGNCSNLHSFECYYSMGIHLSSTANFVFPKLKKLTVYCTEIHGFTTAQVSLI